MMLSTWLHHGRLLVTQASVCPDIHYKYEKQTVKEKEQVAEKIIEIVTDVGLKMSTELKK